MLVQLAAHIFVLVARKLFLIHYCIIFYNNFKVSILKKYLITGVNHVEPTYNVLKTLLIIPIIDWFLLLIILLCNFQSGIPN